MSSLCASVSPFKNELSVPGKVVGALTDAPRGIRYMSSIIT